MAHYIEQRAAFLQPGGVDTRVKSCRHRALFYLEALAAASGVNQRIGLSLGGTNVSLTSTSTLSNAGRSVASKSFQIAENQVIRPQRGQCIEVIASSRHIEPIGGIEARDASVA